MVNRLAVSSGELDAGVAYYGRQVPAADVPKIKAALLLHYAENDDGVNAGIAAYEAALKANNTRYTIHIYPGTQHAFNNDLGAARYNKAAADLAWSRTLAFFKETLGAPPARRDARRTVRRRREAANRAGSSTPESVIVKDSATPAQIATLI